MNIFDIWVAVLFMETFIYLIMSTSDIFNTPAKFVDLY
jgi:hypothetical protein